jgi:hypothetical protein
MGRPAPGTGLFLRKPDYTRDVMEIAGPAGSLATNAFKAGGQVIDGRPGDALTTIAPVAAQNLIKGARMLATGRYDDSKGNKVTDTTTAEAIMKMGGFQPNVVARIQDAAGQVLTSVQLHQEEKSEITDLMARAVAAGDHDALNAARSRLAKWNENNPDSRISIVPTSIRAKVKTMQMDREQRLIRSAPKEIRARVREELTQ